MASRSQLSHQVGTRCQSPDSKQGAHALSPSQHSPRHRSANPSLCGLPAVPYSQLTQSSGDPPWELLADAKHCKPDSQSTPGLLAALGKQVLASPRGGGAFLVLEVLSLQKPGCRRLHPLEALTRWFPCSGLSGKSWSTQSGFWFYNACFSLGTMLPRMPTPRPV